MGCIQLTEKNLTFIGQRSRSQGRYIATGRDFGGFVSYFGSAEGGSGVHDVAYMGCGE